MWLQYWNSKFSHASFHWKSCETLPFQYCSLHKAFKTDIQPNTSRHSKQTRGTTWWCPYLQPPLGETTAILVASTAVPHPTQSEIRPTGTVLSQCVKASGWERGKMTWAKQNARRQDYQKWCYYFTQCITVHTYHHQVTTKWICGDLIGLFTCIHVGCNLKWGHAKLERQEGIRKRRRGMFVCSHSIN